MWKWMLMLWPGLVLADTAGEFDYYVMALSWSPNWCELEGDRRDAPQCEQARGWVLHGLWPQYERGYPTGCTTRFRNPSRRDTAQQAGLFGSSGSAWHQWNKHGRCVGISAAEYYELSQEAYDSVTRPEVLRKLDREVTLPASLIEDAFLRDNPGLSADGLTVTCKAGGIQEVRICLTRDLEPRRCGADVRRDCTLPDAWLMPVE